MTWNEVPMTLRTEGKDDKLTHAGGRNDWGAGDGVHYQNLPPSLKEKMPLYGTQDVNTNDANTLYLLTKTMGYMFRISGWSPVDMDGWMEVSMGSYLNAHGDDVRLYTREFEAGTYILDNMSAMYLFDPDY